MKGKTLFCLIILIFSFFCIAYAEQQEELSLSEIDKLINKTEYDEALRQINIYIENNPDQFDNAQIRVDRIMNAKIKYSELAEELLDIIRNDPTNNKRIYEITSELEKFEKNPSDKNLKFIADLKRSAEFNYFRALFMDIQNEIAENVLNSNYIAAVQKSQEGFWLYRENFDNQWKNYPEIITSVNNVMGDLTANIKQFCEKNFISEIVNVVDEFIKAVNADNYSEAINKFLKVKQKMANYNDLRNKIISDKETMDAIFAKLQSIDPDVTDASFLPFMTRFIIGTEGIEYSGILSAVNQQWHDLVAQMNNAVFAMVTKKYNNYTVGIDDNFENGVKKYALLNKEVLDIYNLTNSSKLQLENPLADYYILTKYVIKLTESANNGIKTATYVSENRNKQNLVITELEGVSNFNEKLVVLSNIIEYSEKLEETVGLRSESQEIYETWSKDYRDGGYTNWDDLTSLYLSTLDKIYKDKDEIINKGWKEITKIYINESQRLYDELYNFVEIGKNFKSGIFTKLPAEAIVDIESDITKIVYYNELLNTEEAKSIGLHYCYPDISLKIYDYVLNEIDLRIAIINEYIVTVNNEYSKEENWVTNESILAYVGTLEQSLNNNIKSLNSLRNQCFEQQKLSKDMIIAAEISKNEGDVRFAEAEKALARNDFAVARKKLQIALTKYDEALSKQNNEELRSELDEKLQKLGEEITNAENQLVVQQVRELKNAAKDAYFNGRFEDAEKYLNQASAKWALTNVTEDPEITNLMNFVNTAISMKTGREILPSAPQYPEMSQLLSIAHKSFDLGSKLLKQGKVEEADKEFEIALNNIQKVQYVYPLNQEAALLTLQINQIRNPKKFREEFSNKIEVALRLCENTETQQEGYANLLDYYKIDPTYPGLKNKIYQVEIDIGIRQKPVDNSGIKKADKYITEAKNIFNKAGDNLEKLNQALNVINQALAIVPNNTEAMALKDEITTKMGGNASTVLSTEDERLYQMAIQRLQNNNIVGANAIVDQLLKKPQNRYSQKIKDLKNKIDARS